MDIFANSVAMGPCGSKKQSVHRLSSKLSKYDTEPFLSSENRKLRRGFRNLFHATSCCHFEIVKMGVGSSEHKPGAFVGDRATLCSGRGHFCRRRYRFPLKAKCL